MHEGHALKIADSSKRVDFLRTIIAESQSDLYTMNLIRRIEDDLKPDQSEVYEQEQIAKLNLPSPSLSTSAKKKLNLRSDVEKIKTDFAAQLRNHYLAPNAPSVFEQFGDLGAGKIEPNVFLLGWRTMGGDSESEQKKYLKNLFTQRPQDLNNFLRLLFRADFIDDYSALKPIIDYKELSGLIDANESIFDEEKGPTV